MSGAGPGAVDRWPRVTVGVLTTGARREAFAKLLTHLAATVAAYRGEVSLRVCNNGGEADAAEVRRAVADSAVADALDWRVLDSPRNNIATGRNLVLDDAPPGALVAFLDDDEYPRPDWLPALVRGWRELDAPIVAGPILPVYPPGTPRWIRGIDVHNVRGKRTGDAVRFVASGNFLAELDALAGHRFDDAYGESGGEDTELFLRLLDAGVRIRWVAEAAVDEDIPPAKATAAYAFRRALSQGAYYRRIVAERGEMGSAFAFSARAAIVGAASLVVAAPLMLAGHRAAGDWFKRGASNLGKLAAPARSLYR